jgi:hypothetical protein
MILAKNKLSLNIPASAPLAEPIRLPRPGRPWTVLDLLVLSGDENRYELSRGDLIMMSPASPTQKQGVKDLWL